MNALKILKGHCEFKNPHDCYVLLAVSRKKDTPEFTQSKEIVFREVIENVDNIEKKYNKIMAQVRNYRDTDGKTYPFYVYINMNSRDAKKATAILMNKIMYWLVEESNGVDRSAMFKKLYGHFYSCLMKLEARSTKQKYFLIDYDEKGRINDFLSELVPKEIKYEAVYETRNGYHIKLKPFDRRLLEDLEDKYIFELKTDALMFVTYVENKLYQLDEV